MTTIRHYHSVRRHDDKQADGMLSPKGIANARLTGMLISGPLHEIYSSHIPRAVATAEGIWFGKYSVVPSVEQASHTATAPIKTTGRLAEINPPVPEGLSDRTAILDYWLTHHFGDDVNTKDGIMRRMGEDLLCYVADKAQIIKNKFGTDGTVEYITHAPNIEAAVVRTTPGARVLADIGGYFRPGEGFMYVIDFHPKSGSVDNTFISYRGLNRKLEKLLDIVPL